MKTSNLCAILLSTLVVQISSGTTELDHTVNKVVSSSFEVVAKPINDLLNELQVKSDVEQFLKKFAWTVRDISEQAPEVIFKIFPPEERENKKKLIGYMSMYMSGAFSKATKTVSSVTNKSFETLPDDIKTKLLDIGNDVNVFIKKISGTNMNDSKTSQKTSE